MHTQDVKHRIRQLVYTANVLTICRQFSEKMFFTKLVQNHFPKVFCWFSNFQKIVRKLTENSPKNVRLQLLLKAFSRAFITFRSFPRVWDNFVKQAISVLFGSWILRAGWHYPARWSANQIARKHGRMSSHLIIACFIRWAAIHSLFPSNLLVITRFKKLTYILF